MTHNIVHYTTNLFKKQVLSKKKLSFFVFDTFLSQVIDFSYIICYNRLIFAVFYDRKKEKQ